MILKDINVMPSVYMNRLKKLTMPMVSPIKVTSTDLIHSPMASQDFMNIPKNLETMFTILKIKAKLVDCSFYINLMIK